MFTVKPKCGEVNIWIQQQHWIQQTTVDTANIHRLKGDIPSVV
jgi:hypothetical protein